METKFQTSFIPKQGVSVTADFRPKKSMGFFAFFATLIFFVSIILAGGIFGWKTYLQSQKTTMMKDLDKNIKAFEPQTIEQYVRLDNRINAAKEILSKHIAVSYLFDFLQEKTLQSVQFNDFKYDLGLDGFATVIMNGQAKSYNSVAYQSEVFGSKVSGEQTSFIGPIFSNLDLDQFGNVLFNFNTKVQPGFLSYSRKAATEADKLQTSQKIIPLDVTTPSSATSTLQRNSTSTNTVTPRSNVNGGLTNSNAQ